MAQDSRVADSTSGQRLALHQQVAQAPDRTSMPVAFGAVAQILETRGWCQGRAQDRTGRVSLGGALDDLVGRLATSDRERLVMRARLRNRLCHCAGAGALDAWNDDPARSYGDITDLLRYAQFLSA